MIVPIGILLLAALPAPAPQSHTIENSSVRLAIDDAGSLIELVDLEASPPRNLIQGRPGSFWRLIFHRGRVLENLIDPAAQRYRIQRRGGNELVVTMDRLRHEDTELDVSVEFRIWLTGREIHWRARIDNRDRITIAELFFPEIQGIQQLESDGDADLIWPLGAGIRIRDIVGSLQPRVDHLVAIETPVSTAADPVLETTYPFPATMPWFEISNGRRGLYFGSHDPRFELGALRVSRLFQQGGSLRAGFVKYPFVGPNSVWESGEFVVCPHSGTWHQGAAVYRTWASSWNRPQEKPEWARAMKGFFLVIMRQQYGTVMWRYADLPMLYQEAHANGMDTLGLFGWTEGGHDNGYPDYRPDPDMGGETALKAGIAEVQRRGGRVVLYINGHIMDASSEFYRNHGGQVASRTLWGDPWYEQYNKAGHSSFLRYFNKRLFAPADDGQPLWRKTMVNRALQVLGYGADGVIVDQLGAYCYPCFGPTCSDRPSLAGPQGRIALARDLRRAIKASRPSAGFMTEIPLDFLAPFVDMYHGWGPGHQLGPDAFPQMLRYTFPEMILTSRHQAPRIDRKQANFILAYGFRPELEVRYQADALAVRKGDYPELRDYLGKIGALRDRHWDLLGTGTFLDDRGLQNDSPAITATVFGAGDRRAVVAWNNTSTEQPLRVKFHGKRLTGVDSVEGALAAPPNLLQPQQLVVLVFE